LPILKQPLIKHSGIDSPSHRSLVHRRCDPLAAEDTVPTAAQREFAVSWQVVRHETRSPRHAYCLISGDQPQPVDFVATPVQLADFPKRSDLSDQNS
jgi:hypothetical protein